MVIKELNTLSGQAAKDLLTLMAVLDSTVPVTVEDLQAAVRDPGTHLFVAVEETEAPEGRILGTASLCVTHHPLGRKGGIEDVVVSPDAQGKHIGRRLMEHIIDYARRELSPIELHLTSRPSREAANRLYQAIGFRQHQTNVYKLEL